MDNNPHRRLPANFPKAPMAFKEHWKVYLPECDFYLKSISILRKIKFELHFIYGDANFSNPDSTSPSFFQSLNSKTIQQMEEKDDAESDTESIFSNDSTISESTDESEPDTDTTAEIEPEMTEQEILEHQMLILHLLYYISTHSTTVQFLEYSDHAKLQFENIALDHWLSPTLDYCPLSIKDKLHTYDPKRRCANQACKKQLCSSCTNSIFRQNGIMRHFDPSFPNEEIGIRTNSIAVKRIRAFCERHIPDTSSIPKVEECHCLLKILKADSGGLRNDEGLAFCWDCVGKVKEDLQNLNTREVEWLGGEKGELKTVYSCWCGRDAGMAGGGKGAEGWTCRLCGGGCEGFRLGGKEGGEGEGYGEWFVQPCLVCMEAREEKGEIGQGSKRKRVDREEVVRYKELVEDGYGID